LIPDSSIPSDGEPLATDSETDYSEVDLGPTAKSDSNAPQVADSGSFGSGSTFISGRLVSDHQDKNGDNDGVRDNAELQLTTEHLRLRPTSPGRTFATHQASKIQVNTNIKQGTTSSVNLDVTKEVEDRGFNIVTNGSDKQDKSDAGACSSRRQKDDSTFGSGIPAHDGSCGHSQPLQLDLTAAHQQSDPIAESPPAAHHARKNAPRHARHKRPRSSSSLGLKSTNLEIRQSHASATDPGQERQLCDTNDRITNDLSDENHANHSDASSNTVKKSPPSKRLRRAEVPSSTTHHDLEKDSAYSFELSNRVATTPSTATPQSEEIPIRGFLTLKAVESKVIYYFSFSQDLSPQPGGTYVSRSGDRRDSERSPLQQHATSTYARHSKFSPEDDKLLQRLKEDGRLSWDEIAEQFPGRSKGGLQVHYSTKLKRRSGVSKDK
jgi:hypothetical protein